MTEGRYVFLLLAALAAFPQANAQEPATEVVVKIPSWVAHNQGDQARVDVNGTSKTVSPGSDATFKLAAAPGDSLLVEISRVPAHSTGLASGGVKVWQQSIGLNGSGHVIYVPTSDGLGTFQQWPAVTFQGTEKLDIWIDRVLTGSTRVIKGVSPDKSHSFEWKKGNTLICHTQASLPANIVRTYSCNVTTKTIDEQ